MTNLDPIAALHGLITDDVGKLLYTEASRAPAQYGIVEIGSYHGKSTCYLAAGALDGHHGGPVYAFDPWELVNVTQWCHTCTQPTFSRFKQQIKSVGLADHIVAMSGSSPYVVQHYTGPPIALLHIDADHAEDAVMADYHAWSQCFAPITVVLFDDYGVTHNPGVSRAVAALSQRHGFTVEQVAGGRVARATVVR